MAIDVLERDDLPFPHSLPQFQRLFPDEAACAAYLERTRWSDGLSVRTVGWLTRHGTFPHALGCFAAVIAAETTSLTAGTVMERTHTPLSVCFWAVPGRQPDARHVGRPSFSGSSDCRALRDRLSNPS